MTCRKCDKPAVAKRRDKRGRVTWKYRKGHDLCPRCYRDALNSSWAHRMKEAS